MLYLHYKDEPQLLHPKLFWIFFITDSYTRAQRGLNHSIKSPRPNSLAERQNREKGSVAKQIKKLIWPVVVTDTDHSHLVGGILRSSGF
jgi:hypothetical protein